MGPNHAMELPDGSITHYSYAGNTVTVNDPAGKTKDVHDGRARQSDAGAGARSGAGHGDHDSILTTF